MRQIKRIIIHEADTPTGKPFTVQDIDSWHRTRGFRRKDAERLRFNPGLFAIGYHYVIYIDGTLHTGRDESEVPAACYGYNTTSINICLIGKGVYTWQQWDTLRTLTDDLVGRYPGAEIMGHYQLDVNGKTCPDFDVPAWVAANMDPPAGHIVAEV